jgi:DNA-binding response OmpR family regulator
VKQKWSYEKVDLLLVAPRTQNNGSLRQSLNDLDFREIRTGFDFNDILHALQTRAPDMLISDCHLPGGDVCGLVRDIRAHKIGTNPFMAIVLTTWKPSVELVHEVIDSGADDLIVQPTSRGQLGSRIETLTFNRKPFVVTASYIGPDRRKQLRPDRQQVPLLDVPNTLKAKAMGDVDVISLQQSIDAAIASVNRDKQFRNAAHIEYLVGQILPAYREGRLSTQLDNHLHELLTTGEDVARRLIGTRFGHVGKLCQALVAVTHRLTHASAAPSDKDLRLLPELAKSIRIAFAGTEHAAEVAQQISEAISEPPRRAASAG